MYIDEPIKSKRIELRNLRAEDAEGDYISWLHDPLVTRFLEIRHAPPDGPALAAYIREMNESDENLLLGIYLHNGKHIGNIKLGPIDRLDQRAAIGLLIGDRECWGKGLATEAISSMTEYAFEKLSLNRVEAGCHGSNIGSTRAFVKAGWELEGRRKHRRSSECGWEDEVLMGRVCTECVNKAAI